MTVGFVRWWGSRALAAATLLGGAAAVVADPIQWPTSAGGNGHFYEVVIDTELGWDAAQASAAAAGGYLATITSAAEQQFIENLLRNTSTPTGGFWIGLREFAEGDWQWVTGEPFVYSNWAPTQPDNNGGIEDRGQLLWTLGDNEPTSHRRGWWNDAPEPGWGNNPFNPLLRDLDRRGWIVEYVPEPAGAALLGLGLLGLLRRR